MRTIKFLLVFILFLISCDSDEEQNLVYERIVGKSFWLTHYYDGVNQRDEFLFIKFTFNSDKTVVVNKHDEIINGTWEVYKQRDYNFFYILNMVKFNFPDNSELQTFNNHWMTSVNASNDTEMYSGTASLVLIYMP